MPRVAKYTRERFWEHVDKSGDCWEWQGNRNYQGYGTFGQRYTTYSAHRVAYELTYGPIPVGLCVCHHCDNPPCCRPDHLFLGTVADNMRDRSRKGRFGPHGLYAGSPEQLGVAAAAKILGVKREYVYQLVKRGELTQHERPFYSFGYFVPEELYALRRKWDEANARK